MAPHDDDDHHHHHASAPSPQRPSLMGRSVSDLAPFPGTRPSTLSQPKSGRTGRASSNLGYGHSYAGLPIPLAARLFFDSSQSLAGNLSPGPRPASDARHVEDVAVHPSSSMDKVNEEEGDEEDPLRTPTPRDYARDAVLNPNPKGALPMERLPSTLPPATGPGSTHRHAENAHARQTPISPSTEAGTAGDYFSFSALPFLHPSHHGIAAVRSPAGGIGVHFTFTKMSPGLTVPASTSAHPSAAPVDGRPPSAKPPPSSFRPVALRSSSARTSTDPRSSPMMTRSYSSPVPTQREVEERKRREKEALRAWRDEVARAVREGERAACGPALERSCSSNNVVDVYEEEEESKEGVGSRSVSPSPSTNPGLTSSSSSSLSASSTSLDDLSSSTSLPSLLGPMHLADSSLDPACYASARFVGDPDGDADSESFSTPVQAPASLPVVDRAPQLDVTMHYHQLLPLSSGMSTTKSFHPPLSHGAEVEHWMARSATVVGDGRPHDHPPAPHPVQRAEEVLEMEHHHVWIHPDHLEPVASGPGPDDGD